MVIREFPEKIIPNDSPFRNAIYLLGVSGGQKSNFFNYTTVSNPEFDSALRNSLQANGLSTNDKKTSKYYLDVTLKDFYRKFKLFFASGVPVRSTIRYKLKEKGRDAFLMDKTIIAIYVPKYGEFSVPSNWELLALEGSVRENIKAFLRELASLRERE